VGVLGTVSVQLEGLRNRQADDPGQLHALLEQLIFGGQHALLLLLHLHLRAKHIDAGSDAGLS